jgi:hypothetical protein
MFTCLVKYEVDLAKLSEFKEYATAWISLIEKYGGTHHGYFIPPWQPMSCQALNSPFLV